MPHSHSQLDKDTGALYHTWAERGAVCFVENVATCFLYEERVAFCLLFFNEEKCVYIYIYTHTYGNYNVRSRGMNPIIFLKSKSGMFQEIVMHSRGNALDSLINMRTISGYVFASQNDCIGDRPRPRRIPWGRPLACRNKP